MQTDDKSGKRGFDRWFQYLYKRSAAEHLVLVLVILVGIISFSIALLEFNKSKLISTPTNGGTLREGMVGAPRFLNPVLAITRVDYDLNSLLYRGLMTINTDGNLVPDLADNITISEDGTVYNVILKDNIFFSDGTPITANDVAFTIGLIKTPELKSPLYGHWTEVKVEVISDKEINFVLDEAYSPFVENLTVGVMPKHIWENLSAEELPFSKFNNEPVGSGLYYISETVRNEAGLISKYILTTNPSDEPKPKLNKIEILFFSNEESLMRALDDNALDATASLSDENLNKVNTEKFSTTEFPLPRVFGVFINKAKNPALRDDSVRDALNTVINREKLIDYALFGYGEPTRHPVPSNFYKLQSTSTTIADDDRIKEARISLLKGGWKEDVAGGWKKDIDGNSVKLSLQLSTANNPSLAKSAEYLKEVWGELGVEVKVALFENSDLVQTVIRPRDFELLLFGMDIGRSLDLYPFWHSSQREDPGLNISSYTDIKSDDLLEQFRVATSTNNKSEILAELVGQIDEDTPAIYLYNPSFVYIYKKGLVITPIAKISRPSDRFNSISDWYIDTELLWPIFNKKN